MGGRVAPGGGAHLLDAHAELLALDAAVLLRRGDARLERAHRPLERVDLRVRGSGRRGEEVVEEEEVVAKWWR